MLLSPNFLLIINYKGQHYTLAELLFGRLKLICRAAVQFSVILLYKSALLTLENLTSAAAMIVSVCVCVPDTGIWQHGPAG